MKLSIIVPTRNRQKYCLVLINELLSQNPEGYDLEVVIADNSDDGEILKHVCTEARVSKWLKYIPPEAMALSMEQNTLRAIDACTGEWICLVGDDDYIDVRLVNILTALQKKYPTVDAVRWPAVSYAWPDLSEVNGISGTTKISLSADILAAKKQEIMGRMLGWKTDRPTPVQGFSLYHGALRRDLLDRIEAKFDGILFGDTALDWMIGLKATLLSNLSVYVMRPVSILGACVASNSSTTRNPDKLDDVLARERREHFGLNEYLDPNMPFRHDHGLPAMVLQTHRRFLDLLGGNVKGWEVGFVGALVRDTERQANVEFFEKRKHAIQQVLRTWNDGKYFGLYDPIWQDPSSTESFTGLDKRELFMSNIMINNFRTPGEFYRLLDSFLLSPKLLVKLIEGGVVNNEE